MSGTLDRSTFEAIDAYVLDRMGTEERAAFETRMRTDPGLAQEVDRQREHIHAIELAGIRRTIQGIAVEHGSTDRSTSGMSPVWRYAAVVAALVTLAAGLVWWSTRPTGNEQLFAEYFQPDPGLPVTMGATGDLGFANAMVLYKEGRYAEAREALSHALVHEPSNDTLRYFMASSWLAGGDARSAIPLFASLANEAGSTFHDRAQWFLLLAYIKAGEIEKARAVASEDHPVYGERVRALKARL